MTRRRLVITITDEFDNLWDTGTLDVSNSDVPISLETLIADADGDQCSLGQYLYEAAEWRRERS